MADTVAILLAAGESRRMGSSKALLPWQGTTLLAHQISVLRQGGVDKVVVVLGHRADNLKSIVEGIEGVSWTLNHDYNLGKITSIKAGLDFLDQRELYALLILNVDQPRSPDTIRDLLEHHRQGGGLITIPTYGGKGGHPIVVASSLLHELRSITEETLGLKAVVQANQEFTQRLEMSTPEVLWDLNTPEEYQEALRSGG